MIDFYSIFVDKHGIPDDIEYLYNYINFVQLNAVYTKNNEEYYEYHHILPRSVFPEYANNDENVVLLEYKDHIKAHELLFYAYNLRVYQRPLNYYNSDYNEENKSSKRVSKAAKKGWEKLKNNDEKYSEWRKKHSEYMSSITHEEQQRRAKLHWNNISNEKRKEFSDKMKSIWTNEKREKQSNIVLQRYKNNPEYKEKISTSLKKRYDNTEFKENFDNTMNIVNKDENKRKKAGDAIKNKWKDAAYLEKMRKRKAPSKKVIVIKNDGEKNIFQSMKDCCTYYNISMYILRNIINNKCNNIPDFLKNCIVIYG